MKILSLHNKYLIGGGEDHSKDVEISLLRQMGYQVDEFVEDNKHVAEMGLIRTSVNTIWSRQSYRLVKKLLHENKYDYVIVQNTFPLLSSSVYYAAKSENVPVIQFLRNYRSFCLNGLAFRENKTCLDCLGKKIAWPGIFYRCYRNSFLGSAVVSFMLLFNRLMNTWQKEVDCYVALSQFSKDLSITAGIPSEKIIVKPNFVYPDPGLGKGEGGYALYVGRLSSEKGIVQLLHSWLSFVDPLKLVIVGEGPLQAEVTTLINNHTMIEYLGKKSQGEVFELMKNAMFLIFPSLCFEGMPRAVIESFAVGTPVLASGIGATLEMIDVEKNGLIYDPQSASDLYSKVKSLEANPEILAAMRLGARESYEKIYSLANNVFLWNDIQKFVKKSSNQTN